MTFKITKEQQIKELVERVPPIVNVSVVVSSYWKYLVGKRNPGLSSSEEIIKSSKWLFPGSRMMFHETPQETALRVLEKELPGVKAQLKKLITVLPDQGHDRRAYGITLYYLFDYLAGEPSANEQLVDFKWVDGAEFNRLAGAYEVEKVIFNEVDVAVRTMNSTEDEILVEVDADDHEIGSIIKRDAHSTSTRYHRAAHIMIFNTAGDVVLQQRGLNKAHNPGRWDMIGGHQAVGSSIEQTAQHELLEELGIETELTFVRKGLYNGERQSEFYYLYEGVHDGPYDFDPNEVAQVKTFNCKDLLDGKYKEYEILPHVYTYVEELYSKHI
jgi:isopentenyl-diphosphate Delta-isomerase